MTTELHTNDFPHLTHTPRERTDEVRQHIETAVKHYAAMTDPFRQILGATPNPADVVGFAAALEWLVANTTFDVAANNAEHARRPYMYFETPTDPRAAWVSNITLMAQFANRETCTSVWEHQLTDPVYRIDEQPAEFDAYTDNDRDTPLSSTLTWPLYYHAVQVAAWLEENHGNIVFGQADYAAVARARGYVQGAAAEIARQHHYDLNEGPEQTAAVLVELTALWTRNIEAAAQRLVESRKQ